MYERVERTAELIEDLRKLPRAQRASFLAILGLPPGPSLSGDEWATGLAALEDERLEEASRDAGILAQWAANASSPNQELSERLDAYLATLEDLHKQVLDDPDFEGPDKERVLGLLQDLSDALRASSTQGDKPVAAAVRALAGDMLLHQAFWSRVRARAWAKSAGVLVLGVATVVGAYPGGKEVVRDLSGLLSPPPAITAPHAPEPEVHEAEIVPDDEASDQTEPR